MPSICSEHQTHTPGCPRCESTFDATGSPDHITEVLARAWIKCDPNRGGVDPDAPIDGAQLQIGATLVGKPEWHWFIPRAVALRDYLSDNGLVIRPKV